MVFWDDLGFATNYEIDAALEYPGDGKWDARQVVVGRELGAGPIALISPTDGEPWLLSASIGIGGVYGTPDPDRLCLFDRGSGTEVIDVRRPDRRRTLSVGYPTRIAAVLEPQLLLITEPATVYAYDADGEERWRSPAVAFDVHVQRTDNGRIVCRGFARDGITPTESVLDAATGLLIDGDPLF